MNVNGVSNPWTGAASAGVQPTGIGALQKQYPHLKLSAQTFSGEAAIRQYAQNQTGKYNVAIDPRALTRMDSDSEFSDRIHGILAETKEVHDRSEALTNASGARVIAKGTVIDKDGNVGYWGVVQTGSGEKTTSAGKKSIKDLLEELLEKRRETAKEEDVREQQSVTEQHRIDTLSATVGVKTNAGPDGQSGPGLDTMA